MDEIFLTFGGGNYTRKDGVITWDVSALATLTATEKSISIPLEKLKLGEYKDNKYIESFRMICKNPSSNRSRIFLCEWKKTGQNQPLTPK
jgi:hypothetical protein